MVVPQTLKVFVHGNPETAAIWNDLVAELSRRGVDDVVCVSPPGFGAPVPDGFDGTAEAYRQWLADMLRSWGGDVDLVGHDWGAGHVFGVLAAQPELVRSWAADCAGLLHPEYEWHDMAQAWQAPEMGEQVVDAMVGMSHDDFVSAFAPLGMGTTIASLVRQGVDAEMGRCILSLYRSAAQPRMRELGDTFRARRPRNGLVVIAENDHYAGTDAMAAHLAVSVGASVARIPGCGHWWMVERPDLAADALIAHWESVGDGVQSA